MIVFFDLDGTIIDIKKRWYTLHLDVSKYYNLPHYDYKTYITKKREGVTEEEIMGKLSNDKKLIKLYCKKRLKLIEQRNYLKYDKISPGILSVLRLWSKNGKMMLITSRKSPQNLIWELKNLSLYNYFEKIFITNKKNRETILKETFPPCVLKNSVFISDSLDDYILAKKLSIKPIIISYGCRSVNYFKRKGLRNIIKNCNELKLLAL
jgi:beta-phosphoglucomutase-like phosphatase (HAD superfamily)